MVIKIPAKKAAAVQIIDAATSFSYAALEPKLADKLKASADAIRGELSNINAVILNVGSALVAIKENLPHGEFGKWLEFEFNMTVRTAQNYMLGSVLLQDCPEADFLPASVIYKLASPGVPPAVREDIIMGIKAGELTDPSTIVSQIAAHKVIKPKAASTAVATSPSKMNIAALSPTDAARILWKLLKANYTGDHDQLVKLFNRAGAGELQKVSNGGAGHGN